MPPEGCIAPDRRGPRAPAARRPGAPARPPSVGAGGGGVERGPRSPTGTLAAVPTLGLSTDLLIGWGRLLFLVLTVLGLLAFCAYPMRKRYPDDQGDGRALVLLPRPRLPEYWRAPALVVLFAVLYVVYESVHGPLNPDTLYAKALTRITEAVVTAPAQVNGYLAGFTLGLRFLIIGTLLCLAVLGRGNVARRLLVLLQAVWYVATMLAIDALLLVIEVVCNVPVGPTTLIGNFAAVFLAFVVMARTMFVSYALPRPSAVPFVKRPRLNDALTIIGLTFASVAICTAGLVVIYQLADPAWRPALALVAPVPFAEGSSILRTTFLAVMDWLTAPKPPPVGQERPPIDVIVPAYNEAEVIVETLEAIDVAAGRYGGPVHITICNDGSTDDTQELIEATVARFHHATAAVVLGGHEGKSAALNRALAETTADIVVRIDADTLVDEWSLYYIPRWFRYPDVGMVEAMMFPRWRRSVFPHMRLFEELKQFGYNHRTIQTVDGVNVVPGVFTAFRRDVAVELEGFTVGMNGEDGDFTLRFSRMGYRSIMDPKVVVHEDVPPTYPEIREQRVRWSRATMHNNSRHGAYRAGVGTPKVWFSQAHQYFERVFSPARLMLPFYLVLVAVFEGTYRAVVVTFLGAWVVFSLAFMALETLLAFGYRQVRHLGWVVLWPVWQEFLTLFSTEAWLSLPGRPAGLEGSRPERIERAVVH